MFEKTYGRGACVGVGKCSHASYAIICPQQNDILAVRAFQYRAVKMAYETHFRAIWPRILSFKILKQENVLVASQAACEATGTFHTMNKVGHLRLLDSTRYFTVNMFLNRVAGFLQQKSCCRIRGCPIGKSLLYSTS